MGEGERSLVDWEVGKEGQTLVLVVVGDAVVMEEEVLALLVQ